MRGVSLVVCCRCGKNVSDYQETGRIHDEYICDTCVGQTWEQLRKTPAQLMKLVVNGKADVVGKDQYGRLLYVLK